MTTETVSPNALRESERRPDRLALRFRVSTFGSLGRQKCSAFVFAAARPLPAEGALGGVWFASTPKCP